MLVIGGPPGGHRADDLPDDPRPGEPDDGRDEVPHEHPQQRAAVLAQQDPDVGAHDRPGCDGQRAAGVVGARGDRGHQSSSPRTTTAR